MYCRVGSTCTDTDHEKINKCQAMSFYPKKNNKVDDNRDNAEKINKNPKILVMSWCLYNVKEIIFLKKNDDLEQLFDFSYRFSVEHRTHASSSAFFYKF